MRFANANKLHRKSGGVKPRDLQFPPQSTNADRSDNPPLCHPDPDFLYVARSMTACAAFSKESRMRFANANKLHRKSGERSRGICSSPHQQQMLAAPLKLICHPERSVPGFPATQRWTWPRVRLSVKKAA
jgi:hypothetical protein